MSGRVARPSIAASVLRPTLAFLFCSAVFWSVWGYRFQRNLDRAYEARRLAQKIHIVSLEMRREQDEFLVQDVHDIRFYRTGESGNIRDQHAYFLTSLSLLDELGVGVPAELRGDLVDLRSYLKSANRIFSELLAAYVAIGSPETGLKGSLRTSLDTFEQSLGAGRVDLDLRLRIVRLRMNEQASLAQVRNPAQTFEDLANLKSRTAPLGRERRALAFAALDDYASSFRGILELTARIGTSETGLMGDYYSEMEKDDPIVSKLVSSLEENARTERARFYVMAGAALLFMLLSALYVMIQVARGISKPIAELRDKTVRFRETGEKAVAGENRIAELQLLDEAFCEMTQNLDRTQAQLLQAQKMESIGTLAGGIAHDFNNLLAGILAYAGIVKKRHSSNPDSVKELEIIEQSAERGAGLTRQILGFARQGTYEKVTLDVNKTIVECRNLLHRTLEKTIALKTELGKDLSPIVGDPGQILQALMNLGVNARDAMPDGGELLFESRNFDADDAFCRSHGKLKPGRYVRITVSDTGGGMTKQVQERIFDPFFTTKEVGKGTGLGLSMVYGILQKHGGQVSVYSERGHGSQFHLYFPAVVTATQPVPVPAPAVSTPPGRSARTDRLQGAVILVADDEALMRNLAKDILEAEGATVFLASEGQEALDFLTTNHSLVNVVVLDVIMPRLDGLKAAREIHRLYAELPIIFSSGYSESGAIMALRQDFPVGFIQKPYKADALVEIILQRLDPAVSLPEKRAA